MLTAVSAAMRSAVRRIARDENRRRAIRRRRWIAQLFAPLEPHARRDEEQSHHEHGGDRDEDHQARVRVGEHPRQHGDQPG